MKAFPLKSGPRQGGLNTSLLFNSAVTVVRELRKGK